MSQTISCRICEDLMPLVKDGIATDDSNIAVKNHIENCNKCRERYKDEKLIDVNFELENSFLKIKRKYRLILILTIIFSTLLGIGITATQNQFYNILLMPVIGIMGYIILRYKSLYIVPIFIVTIHIVYILLQIVMGRKVFYEFVPLIIYDLIYYFFVVLGIVIAGLLHFVFKKEW